MTTSQRPGTDGRFVITGLPAGEYFVAALTEVDDETWTAPEFLGQIVPTATRLTLSPAEKKVQNLRIAAATP